jgi:putative resolvase
VRLDWCPVAREVVVISEAGNPKLDSAEVLEEIVSLMHCYSMKLIETKKKGRGRAEKRL